MTVMDLDALKDILNLVREHELAEFEMEHDGLKVRIRKAGRDYVVAATAPAAAPAPSAGPAPALAPVATAAVPAVPVDEGVPLAVIKADPLFAGWELVRMSRLSVMPVPDALWKRIEELAKKKAAG